MIQDFLGGGGMDGIIACKITIEIHFVIIEILGTANAST